MRLFVCFLFFIQSGVPGITPVDVYLNYTKLGFKLTKISNSGGYLWTCKEVTDDHTFIVEIYSSDINSVTSIRATAINHDPEQDTDDVAKDFLGHVATTPFDGNQPAKMRDWVKNNMGRTGKLSGGDVKIEMIAKPSVRILIIGG